MWGVILALQSSGAVHVGVDILGVVRHVGRLLNGHHGSIPFELVKDGDLLLLIERMLRLRGLDTVGVTKVEGHADEGMVLDGLVREQERVGNNAADEAAGFGRRRVGNSVIDARRNLSGVCGRWYPVILDLHRFFIAISMAVVNHDGNDGTAPDPLVFGLLVPSLRGVGWFMRFVTGLFCPGLLVFGTRFGSMCLQPLSVLMILLTGPVRLVFWLSGLLSWAPFIGLLVVWILELVVSHMLNCLFFMSIWAGEVVFGKGSSSLSSTRVSKFSVGCSFWSRHGYLALL